MDNIPIEIKSVIISYISNLKDLSNLLFILNLTDNDYKELLFYKYKVKNINTSLYNIKFDYKRIYEEYANLEILFKFIPDGTCYYFSLLDEMWDKYLILFLLDTGIIKSSKINLVRDIFNFISTLSLRDHYNNSGERLKDHIQNMEFYLLQYIN